jgi:hypothetical protein
MSAADEAQPANAAASATIPRFRIAKCSPLEQMPALATEYSSGKRQFGTAAQRQSARQDVGLYNKPYREVLLFGAK